MSRVDEPAASGETVTVFRSPQDPNVIDEGLIVATDVSLDDTETTSVVLAVRLQPFLPSPFWGTTKRFVVPFAPPMVNGKTTATASTEAWTSVALCE